MTLYDAVTDWMQHQQHKHALGDDFVERTINGMSQHDFLKALSDALEEAGLMK
jgi:hypothetical protein